MGKAMIVRLETYSGFSNFDLFNDATDTAAWLRRVGRHEEAKELLAKYEQWVSSKSKRIENTCKQSSQSDK